MLTEVKAYSSWQSAPVLLLNETGRAETDLIQIRNIDGLEPVKASVNTSPLAVDGEAYTGSNIPTRNIVLTLHPNPDWVDWSYESLRRLLYSYFMPKRPTRLNFYSDDMVAVGIDGIVEGVEVNMFSEDPELLVSVICPDPYFTALNAVVLTGQSVRPEGDTIDIDYEGTVEAGIHVQVTAVSGSDPQIIGIQIGDPAVSYFTVDATVDTDTYFEMSSVPTKKFVQNVKVGISSSGIIVNLLGSVKDGSSWPVLQPGENVFSVLTDAGVQDWELSYFERFGGL